MNERLVQNIVFAVVMFFLVLFVYIGFRHGRAAAQSQNIVSNANQLAVGLRYFYSDEDRYPTETEFTNRTVFLDYYTQFPPHSFTGKTCPASYAFTNSPTTGVSLSFCLSGKFQNYNKGWNTVSLQ